MICNGCGKENLGDSNFCRFCGNNLNVSSAKIRMTNTFVVVLCLVLIGLLFTRITNYSVNTEQKEVIASHNILDFMESVVNGLSDYTYFDYIKELPDLSNVKGNHTNKLNTFNFYMINEQDGGKDIHRFLIYFNSFVLLMMFILPVILIPLSIVHSMRKQEIKLYKKLFIVTLVLGLILFITIPFMQYNIGFGLILYIVLSTIGILYSYL